MARRAPTRDSKLRSIRGARAWVSTWMVTSAGTRSSSISWRTKSKSVCDAAGKPTSISLNPMRTRSSNMRSLRAGPMGSISAWLPSRRSTLHQTGGSVMVRPGQARSGRSIGWNAVYMFVGSTDMALSSRLDAAVKGAARVKPPGSRSGPATAHKSQAGRQVETRGEDHGSGLGKRKTTRNPARAGHARSAKSQARKSLRCHNAPQIAWLHRAGKALCVASAALAP